MPSFSTPLPRPSDRTKGVLPPHMCGVNSMSLTFMQEDFLVDTFFPTISNPVASVNFSGKRIGSQWLGGVILGISDIFLNRSIIFRNSLKLIKRDSNLNSRPVLYLASEEVQINFLHRSGFGS